MIRSSAKDAYFSLPRTDIVGSAADPSTHIYQIADGTMVRYTTIDSGKGGEPVEILQTSDMHLNFMNEKDDAEARPCILSTRIGRLAFRDGSTVPNTVRTMELAKFFDQTVVTGDTLDYITWGTFDLMKLLIWDRVPGVLVSVGGHDITRVMQGKVPDETSLESRYELLRGLWQHDLWYASKTVGDKVRTVVLNNGESRYIPVQAEKLAAEIEEARREGQIILIFQHEQLCTHNPAEKDAVPLRINDGSGSRNFCDNFCGHDGSDDATMAVYRLITENADVVKGVFCGHWHSDYYTEIMASYKDENGKRVETVIPQYVLTGNMYDRGHILIITVK